jgi:Flp pilus assembly protein protease CpaA
VTDQPERTRRPAPDALDADAVGLVTAGTVGWFVAFLVLLPFRGRLADGGHEVWLWTCLAGGGLGLIGLPLTLRHRAAVHRAAVRRAAVRRAAVRRAAAAAPEAATEAATDRPTQPGTAPATPPPATPADPAG